MQRYTVYFIWKLLYMFQDGTFTHHQERKQLYLQHLVFVTPLLLPAAILVELNSNFHLLHPKQVEQFPDINKLCNGGFCWIYIGIH